MVLDGVVHAVLPLFMRSSSRHDAAALLPFLEQLLNNAVVQHYCCTSKKFRGGNSGQAGAPVLLFRKSRHRCNSVQSRGKHFEFVVPACAGMTLN